MIMEYIEKADSSEFISQETPRSWANCPSCSAQIELGCQVCHRCKYRMTASDLQPVEQTIRHNFMWFSIIGLGASGLLIGIAASLLN